ncbi:U-scoloptoxin(05)-Sm1a [Vanessa tameamea]|uniref:U-scoloptoxin(05)-Sm1a n=1 Tax=Vanessa tameamea TaxID=334116 RepID=A0A8B8IIW1_VANTA|nr:omega-scoloptoxin-Ssm1a [Vanessa tameamea]
MYIITAKYVLFVMLTANTLNSVNSINCYQCSGTDSNEPFECNEYLDTDTALIPTDCNSIHDAQYCIKHVGRFEGGISTKRYCSSLDLGNYCNYVQQPGDKLEYRTCIHTCNTDGCNGASSIQSSAIFSLLVLSISIWIIKV